MSLRIKRLSNADGDFRSSSKGQSFEIPRSLGKLRGQEYRHQHTRFLIIGVQKGTPNLGNPPTTTSSRFGAVRQTSRRMRTLGHELRGIDNTWINWIIGQRGMKEWKRK